MAVKKYPIYCLERSAVPVEIQLDLDGKVLEGEIVDGGFTFENYKIKAGLGAAALQPVLIQVKLVQPDELAELAAAGTPPFYITEDWLQFLEDEDRRAGGAGAVKNSEIQQKNTATPAINIPEVYKWASHATVFNNVALFLDDNFDGAGRAIDIQTLTFATEPEGGVQQGGRVYWPVQASIKWKGAQGTFSDVPGNYLAIQDTTVPEGWRVAFHAPGVDGILNTAATAAPVGAAAAVSAPMTYQEAIGHKSKAKVHLLGIGDDDTEQKIEISDAQFEILGNGTENPVEGTVSWPVEAWLRWEQDGGETDGEEFSLVPATYQVINQAGLSDPKPVLIVDTEYLHATDEALAKKFRRSGAETG